MYVEGRNHQPQQTERKINNCYENKNRRTRRGHQIHQRLSVRLPDLSDQENQGTRPLHRQPWILLPQRRHQIRHGIGTAHRREYGNVVGSHQTRGRRSHGVVEENHCRPRGRETERGLHQNRSIRFHRERSEPQHG